MVFCNLTSLSLCWKGLSGSLKHALVACRLLFPIYKYESMQFTNNEIEYTYAIHIFKSIMYIELVSWIDFSVSVNKNYLLLQSLSLIQVEQLLCW